MIPCSCAASSASAICFAMGSASSSGNRAARNALRQIVALDEFHHEGVDAARLFESVDRSRCCGWFSEASVLRFTLEAREAVGVVREGLGQDLDRDVSVQLRIARPIDLPHAPFADLGGDFVDAEAGAGRKGQ